MVILPGMMMLPKVIKLLFLVKVIHWCRMVSEQTANEYTILEQLEETKKTFCVIKGMLRHFKGVEVNLIFFLKFGNSAYLGKIFDTNHTSPQTW